MRLDANREEPPSIPAHVHHRIGNPGKLFSAGHVLRNSPIHRDDEDRGRAFLSPRTMKLAPN